MEYRELKYLLTLAQTRNMTRAAEQLYISQSALSHYLKCVEEDLGARLFDRSTTPMTLTYAGKCYMDRYVIPGFKWRSLLPAGRNCSMRCV